MPQSKVSSPFMDQVLLHLKALSWSNEQLNSLARISSQLTKDLQPPGGLFFSDEVRFGIEQKAARELCKCLQTSEDLNQLDRAWQNVVRDFYKEKNWGFPAQKQQPTKILSDEQKIRKELASYIGFLIVVLFIIKTAFYIFGMLGSNYQDEPSYTFGFWISLIALIAVTVYFGWKKFNQPQ